MKSIKEKILINQINECSNINNQNKDIFVYVKSIQDKKEYYLNITISKNIFTSEEILRNNLVPLEIYFILHITPNFPINPPRLYCLTSLSAINVNICDVKDILSLVIQTEIWDNKITAKEIILKIPKFLNDIYEKSRGLFFLGKYYLDVEYDYKILTKIPKTYFKEIDQIINEKTTHSERRLLLITDLFFLIFSFEYSMLSSSYNNIKLIFWASIRSIFGMKNTEKMFQFEFSKTDNLRTFLFFNTVEGAKIMDTVFEHLRKIGIDYSINKAKPYANLIEENNEQKKTEAKLLPKMEVLDNNETNEQSNNIENNNNNVDNKESESIENK
jgi:ubiquitin-protein ligase